MTSKHKKTAVISLLVLGIVFFVFLVSIFSNSFKLGTFYPKYSSLRSDPFGTKMLYKSFKQLPEITVTQRIKSFTPLAGKKSNPSHAWIFPHLPHRKTRARATDKLCEKWRTAHYRLTTNKENKNNPQKVHRYF